MSDYLTDQLARIRAEVASLKRDRVTYRTAEVTAVDTAGSTFAANAPGAGTLGGIAAPPQFLPAVGDEVQLSLSGATPIYQPNRIAADAVSYTELAPEVTADMLLLETNTTTALATANGKNTVTYSIFDPSGSGTRAGDPWFKRDATTGVITGSWEWDGDSWEVRKYGDAVLNSLTVGKLTTGTMNADITVSGRFATALSGARREMNAIGFQAYNSSNALTVNIDGVTNLLTGKVQTALTGRRIEIGASGTLGRINFLGPAGTTGLMESYTDTSGVEAIRLVQPISGTWPVWNGLQFQTNDRAYIASGRLDVIFGGAGSGSKAFNVFFATDSGDASSLPTLSSRLAITSDLIRMYVGEVADDGSIDIIPHGAVDTRLRSPKLLLRGEGGTTGHHLKFVTNGDLTSPRVEVSDAADTGYGAIWASAFVVSSAASGKSEIADYGTGALAQVRKLRVRRYKLDERDATGKTRALAAKVGLVAEEAPAELVVDGRAVDVYGLASVTAAAVQELAAQLDELKGGMK